MPIYYKYCEPKGGVIILNEFELKLPFVSDVNDPDDCHPVFYCDPQISREDAEHFLIKQDEYLSRNRNYEEILDEEFGTPRIFETIKNGAQEVQNLWKSKTCLISVTRTHQSKDMWDKYAEKSSGLVIGFDFDILTYNPHSFSGMRPVNYFPIMPPIVFSRTMPNNDFMQVLLTKTQKWAYEQEYRTVIHDENMDDLQRNRAVYLKDFKSKQTWFLRINPESIREVIVGDNATPEVRIKIEELRQDPRRQHVRFS